jgi:Protein of unknown function (DUF3515)
MADPTHRSAARLATLVAVPAAVLVAFLSAWALGGLERARNVPTGPGPSSPPTAAVTAPVAVPARTLAPDVAAVCGRVVAGLPTAIPPGPGRPVLGDIVYSAAYGDPPVVLRCGTAAPSVPPTAWLPGLDGVCWYAVAVGAATEWTTVDRVVPVTVTVPGPVDGSAQSVIPFSAPIARADPRLPDTPSGCR